MRKAIKKLTALTIIVLLAAALTIYAAAIGFSVRPVLPENQRENGNAFFDLLVHPGEQQDLIVNVSNTFDEEITVFVEVVTASTSRYGEIDYTDRGGTMDETLAYSFEDIAQVEIENITIPIEQNIDIPIKLTIPDEPFEGMILGAIRILREPTETEIAESGAITNQYAFAIAVRLVQDENAENIPAEFILTGVRAELVYSRANIIATIRNPQPKIIRGAGVSANIYPINSDTAVFEYDSETFDMAPNSVFDLSFIDTERRGLTAGDYTAIIEITYGGETWNFTENFTIDEQTAEEINEGADLAEQPASFWDSIPLWAIIGIGAVLLVLIAIIILIIVISRKGKRQRTKPPEQTK